MRHWLCAVAGLLILFCGAPPARAGWQVFLPSDGIISQYVSDVDVGLDGSIWFVTFDGVSRYDGLTWTNYPLTPHFQGRSLVNGCLKVDHRGNVWVTTQLEPYQSGTSPKLFRFDGVRWEPVWVDLSSADDILEDRDGNIWIATYHGVLRFDGTNWVTYGASDGLPDERVTCLLQDRQGAMWFGTRTGLGRFREGVWTAFTSVGGVDLGSVYSIFQDGAGALWVGTNPIRRFDGTVWTTYGTATAPPWMGTFPTGSTGTARGFAEDRDGNLWMIVNGVGVVRYRDGVWKVYRDSDDPRMTLHRAITLDGAGDLWLATDLGAVRFDGEDWDSLQPGTEAHSNIVHAILEERPGVFWLGTGTGLYRYENGNYTIYTKENGLLHSTVYGLAFGPDGSLWACGFYGVNIFDGQTWTTRAVSNVVYDVFRHSSGDMYLAVRAGVVRVHGSEWITYDTGSGFPDKEINSFAEDDSGHVWVAAYGYGLGCFDGESWRWYTPDNGLPDASVVRVRCGMGGQIWATTYAAGVLRLDDGVWTSYRVADGLAEDHTGPLLVDHQGVAWVGCTSSASVCRFDGTFWKTFTSLDGVPGSYLRCLVEDHEGRVWVGSEWGAAIIETDRVAPRAFLHPHPATVSASRRQVLPVCAAHGETKGILFSHSLDGAPWSDWTAENTWFVSDLNDGLHDLRVRARDSWGNVSPDPARATIEIDATPPAPAIAPLAAGNAARGDVSVAGKAGDARFGSYRLLVRRAGAGSWDPPAATVLSGSESPVANGILGIWNTTQFPDGDYELRLEVADTLGLVGADIAPVIVDNEAPWAYQTFPATVSATSGGDVYTGDAALHLYFPPRALSKDAVVTAAALSAAEVPDTLVGGAARLQAGWDIGWTDAELQKPATLELSLAGVVEPGAGARPALYRQADGADWERLGGTLDESAHTLTAAIARAGRYAVFTDAAAPGGGGGLSAITMTPRVFSPTGGYAGTEVAISFTLGHSGPVTVRVHNRAGRLVKEVAAGRPLNAGVNVIRWDGRDQDGAVVPDGLYLVGVEAGSEQRVTTLAVVR